MKLQVCVSYNQQGINLTQKKAHVFIIESDTTLDEKEIAERIYKDNELRVYPKKIVALRYFQSTETSSIDYFLEGLTSYEGENWFDENPVEYYIDQGIFETEEEAKEHLRKYNEWYHSDDENNDESNN